MVEEGETHHCRTPAGGAGTGADAGGAGLIDGAGAGCANCVESNWGAYCVEGNCDGDCVRYYLVRIEQKVMVVQIVWKERGAAVTTPAPCGLPKKYSTGPTHPRYLKSTFF